MTKPRVLLLQVEVGQRVAQHHENPVGVERLFEDFKGAELGGFHRRANRGVAADHDHDCGGVELSDSLERLHAVHPRHLHVEEHEVRTPLLVFFYSVGGVGDGVDLISLEFEELPQGGANSLLIVDDENSATHRTLL